MRIYCSLPIRQKTGFTVRRKSWIQKLNSLCFSCEESSLILIKTISEDWKWLTEYLDFSLCRNFPIFYKRVWYGKVIRCLSAKVSGGKVCCWWNCSGKCQINTIGFEKKLLFLCFIWDISLFTYISVGISIPIYKENSKVAFWCLQGQNSFLGLLWI